MKKQGRQFHFVSGIPRSGSSLLVNILNQNPDFFASGTSPVSSYFRNVNYGWSNDPSNRSAPEPHVTTQLLNVMAAILPAAYGHVSEPVVFDKNRYWPSLLGSLSLVLPEKPLVLACVRDMRDVLASVEMLHRKNHALGGSWMLNKHGAKALQVQDRVKLMLNSDEFVGAGYVALQQAYATGYSENIHLVKFEQLTSDPEKTMRMVYAFLGMDYYKGHDFNNVEQVVVEDDRAHGIMGLHRIRPKVTPVQPKWRDVLGEWADQYKNLNFWDNL